MIGFVYGTTGELIKIAPIVRELTASGRPPLLLSTGQQTTQLEACARSLEIPTSSLVLGAGSGGRDLEKREDIPMWLAGVVRRFARHLPSLRDALRSDGKQPVLIVHGDTLTTVLGATMAHALGATCAHVEAGLRSGDWRNPFPEELDRRAASRLARVHYAPDPVAASNLRKSRVRGRIVETQGNTVRDTLRFALGTEGPTPLPEVVAPFGVVSIHRFELLAQIDLLRETLSALKDHAHETPLLFIDHPVTASVIQNAGLQDMFDPIRFRRVERMAYVPFVRLIGRAEFLVTDSGGSQEECAYLGLPCAVHRTRSERIDGLAGGPVMLTGQDVDQLKRFLDDPSAWRRAEQTDAVSPSDRIVDDLLAHE